jgi:hypothetical protein
VTNLTSADFLVTDDGIARPVTAVAGGPLPLRVTLVLDSGGSVTGPRFASLVSRGYALTNLLRPADQISLISFSHQASLQVGMGRSFDAFRRALGRLSADGGRSLYDAVNLALIASADPGATDLVLLVAEGRDATSFLSPAQVVTTAQRSRAIVHAFGNRSDPFLQRLTEVTGGRVWRAGSERQLDESIARAIEETRAGYVIAYTLAGDRKPGWHEIKVSLSRGRGDVIARAGHVVR